MSNDSLDLARRLLGQPRFTVRSLRDDLVELHGWPTASDATLAFGASMLVRVEEIRRICRLVYAAVGLRYASSK